MIDANELVPKLHPQFFLLLQLERGNIARELLGRRERNACSALDVGDACPKEHLDPLCARGLRGNRHAVQTVDDHALAAFLCNGALEVVDGLLNLLLVTGKFYVLG
eukprot:scaffold99850_cov23-Tisochrysis_lutea.AAC.1